MGPQKNSGWLQPLTNHTCTSVLACDQWRASCESKHKVRPLGCLYVYIYRWVNRPREIQWLLKIAVHLGVKPVAAQTPDIWPNAPSCLLTPPHHYYCCHMVFWELAESTLSKPHSSSMAGCVTPREKGNCREWSVACRWKGAEGSSQMGISGNILKGF